MKTSCKCGNIQVEWGTKNKNIVARMCGCKYCTDAKAEYVSDPKSLVHLKINDIEQVNKITHGHGTADFIECTECGLVLVKSEIEGELYCLLNSKTLSIQYSELDPDIKNYSAESVNDRLSRRKENWSKMVHVL